MTQAVLIRNTARAFVLADYLRQLHAALGTSAYLASVIRKEHGTGQGFFGISNTGSYDCLKEALRGITDGLDLRYTTFDQVRFVSARCRGLARRSRDLHRIEHTLEIIEQFRQLEQRFILGTEPLTPNALGRWVIENQIVCLIEQDEQAGQYTEAAPFRKYASPIYYQDRDVSDYSHDQIRCLTRQAFAAELGWVDRFDFSAAVSAIRDKLICLKGKHRLPPLALAVRLAGDELALLAAHYVDKRCKAIDPASRYFKPSHAARWHAWESAQAGDRAAIHGTRFNIRWPAAPATPQVA